MSCPFSGGAGGGGSCPVTGHGRHTSPVLPPRPSGNGASNCPTASRFSAVMSGGSNNYPPGYSSFGAPAPTSPPYSDIDASWRQAFGSIESIIRTCSSVTMMLDSTYFAVFNCYRAIAGLGEHFSDMKRQIVRISNKFPLFRWAIRLVRFLLRLVGLSHLIPSHFAAFNEKNQQQAFLEAWASVGGTSAPVLPPLPSSTNSGSIFSLVYFCVVFGLPWLLWKLMSITVERNAQQRQWFRQGVPHPMAVAQFDFASDRPEELSFLRGAKVHLAPLEIQPHPRSGWLLATIDGKRFGMVPKNYLAAPTLIVDDNNGSNLVENKPQVSDESSGFGRADA